MANHLSQFGRSQTRCKHTTSLRTIWLHSQQQTTTKTGTTCATCTIHWTHRKSPLLRLRRQNRHRLTMSNSWLSGIWPKQRPNRHHSISHHTNCKQYRTKRCKHRIFDIQHISASMSSPRRSRLGRIMEEIARLPRKSMHHNIHTSITATTKYQTATTKIRATHRNRRTRKPSIPKNTV